MKTKLIVEQHFHGAYGVDFNKASVNEIVDLAEKLRKIGIGKFFPTLVTDSVENTKRQISVIKEAAKKTKSIMGIHLEGIFINPEKKGIHNPEHFLHLTVDNYRLLEDDFIKIVTLAPELDEGLIDYLREKNIKVQAGHCVGFGNVNGATHTFNAMSGITHRGASTALSSLISDTIFTEIIADGVHVSNDALKLVFKTKPADKIILISDSLPITKSNLKEITFADEKVYYDGIKATSKDGTIAGSTTMLPDIIKRLASLNMFNPEYINNPYDYHNINLNGYIEWDDEWNITNIYHG